MEIKEIELRSWVIDALAILIILGVIVGVVAYSGVQLEVYPTNTKLVLKDNLNSNILNINIKQDKEYFFHNLTAGNLEHNSQVILNTTLATTMIEIKNPEPSARYISISFDAVVNVMQLRGVVYNYGHVYGNLGFIGVMPSENELNYTPLSKQIAWVGITDINADTSDASGTTVFDSFQSTVGGIEQDTILYYNIIYRNTQIHVSPIYPQVVNVPIRYDAIYRGVIHPEYDINHHALGSYKTVKIHYTFEIDYRVPSASKVVITYRDRYTGENVSGTLPLVLKVMDNPRYIYIVLIESQKSVPQDISNLNAYGIKSIDNIEVFAGDVNISVKTLATTIFVIFGFLLMLGVFTYSVFRNGFNSAEAMLLSIGAMLIVIGILGTIIPSLVISKGNAVLTVLTFSLLVVWLMFRYGKINFKSQIDEWFAEHSDALFFGVLVLTIIQYIFNIFG